MEDKKENLTTLNLKQSELFQLHLCVLNRMGNAQIKFCNAMNEEEQKTAEGLLMFLQSLDMKLLHAYKGDDTNGKEK